MQRISSYIVWVCPIEGCGIFKLRPFTCVGNSSGMPCHEKVRAERTELVEKAA